MSDLPRRHAFRPADADLLVGGPCSTCGMGRLAPQHQVPVSELRYSVDDITDRIAAADRARELAARYRELCGADPQAVAGFTAILAALPASGTELDIRRSA